MYQRHKCLRVFDFSVVTASLTIYVVALGSTAINSFWTGPDFTHPPRSGWWCLLFGWNPFFGSLIGWLANPVYFLGIITLIKRRLHLASVLGLMAIGLVLLWRTYVRIELPDEVIAIGYEWWKLSIIVFAAGSILSLLFSIVIQRHASMMIYHTEAEQ